MKRGVIRSESKQTDNWMSLLVMRSAPNGVLKILFFFLNIFVAFFCNFNHFLFKGILLFHTCFFFLFSFYLRILSFILLFFYLESFIPCVFLFLYSSGSFYHFTSFIFSSRFILFLLFFVLVLFSSFIPFFSLFLQFNFFFRAF